MTSGDGQEDGDGPERVITLTDGVVAIAMTLLALDLKPALPRDASTHRLVQYFSDEKDAYIAFVIAFAIIAQYWVIHHRVMRRVVRHDEGLTWVNMLFLFGITLMPLTTYLVGNLDSPLATSIFAGTFVVLSVSVIWMSELIERRGLAATVRSPDQQLRVRWRRVMSVVIPVAVGALTWVMPHASYLFFLFFVADLPGTIAVRRRRVTGGPGGASADRA